MDLQFIFSLTAASAQDIQKTIIFVNAISDICPIIKIIQKSMKMLGYPEDSNQWIRPYHSTMSDWNKAIIAKAFQVVQNENTDYIILVTTNAYGMGIDNPNIKFVIQ